MKTKCRRCKKRIAGKPEEISFDHFGITVTIFKDGSKCADCVKEEWLEKFNEYGGKDIVVVNPNPPPYAPTVNWRKYLEIISRRYETRSEGEGQIAHHILIPLGFLSLMSMGNWNIVGLGPIGLNPRSYGTYLYFTHREDATYYARLIYSRTLFDWEIQRITEVIPRKELASLSV